MTDREAWIRFASAALGGAVQNSDFWYPDECAVHYADKMLEKLRERFPSDEPEVPDQYQEPAEPPATDPYEGIPKEVMARVEWWSFDWGQVMMVDGKPAMADEWDYAITVKCNERFLSCPLLKEPRPVGIFKDAKAFLIREAMRDGVFGEEYRS